MIDIEKVKTFNQFIKNGIKTSALAELASHEGDCFCSERFTAFLRARGIYDGNGGVSTKELVALIKNIS